MATKWQQKSCSPQAKAKKTFHVMNMHACHVKKKTCRFGMVILKMNGMSQSHTCHVKGKNMQVWHGCLENEWHARVAYMPCKEKNMQVWPGCLENEWHVTRIKTLNKNLHRHPSNGNIVKNDITFFMWLMGQKGAKLL
jgi:hypothetical protein